jgi:hypothetical protein
MFLKKGIKLPDFWSEPSSDHAVPTAAELASYLFTAALGRDSDIWWYSNDEHTYIHTSTHTCTMNIVTQAAVYWSEGQNVSLAFLQFSVRCFRTSYRSYSKHLELRSERWLSVTAGLLWSERWLSVTVGLLWSERWLSVTVGLLWSERWLIVTVGLFKQESSLWGTGLDRGLNITVRSNTKFTAYSFQYVR